jgi:hypothetical protein
VSLYQRNGRESHSVRIAPNPGGVGGTLGDWRRRSLWGGAARPDVPIERRSQPLAEARLCATKSPVEGPTLRRPCAPGSQRRAQRRPTSAALGMSQWRVAERATPSTLEVDRLRLRRPCPDSRHRDCSDFFSDWRWVAPSKMQIPRNSATHPAIAMPRRSRFREATRRSLAADNGK